MPGVETTGPSIGRNQTTRPRRRPRTRSMTAATTPALAATEPPSVTDEPPGSGDVRALGDRLARLLRPVRILDAVRCGDAVEEAFFAAGGRQLPPVTRDTYLRKPLPFDLAPTRQALVDLGKQGARKLGKDHPAARLLQRRC